MIFAPLALVFFLSFRVHKMSVGAAQLTFWVYAALVGVSFASLGLIYAHESIARVFFITAASFGALSMWGYTTRRDLTGMGSFLFMGLVGLIIASIVNIFLASSAMQFVISVVGVLVFAGLTAYDTQKIKEMYLVSDLGRSGRAQGDHGRAQPLPRLHQHVPHAAAAVRQSRVAAVAFDKAPGGNARGFSFGSAFPAKADTACALSNGEPKAGCGSRRDDKKVCDAGTFSDGTSRGRRKERADLRQIMAAPENHAALRHHRIGALAAGMARVLLNPVKWGVGAAAEDREHRLFVVEIDRIVPPLAVGDLRAVDREYRRKLPAVERYARRHRIHV